MAAKMPNIVTEEAKALRREAGKVIAALRKDAELSQKKVADLLGFEYYTTISQWERGYIRLPSDTFKPLAEVLGQDPDEFTLRMMRYYEPQLHESVLNLLKKARNGG